ncbi:ARM repeat-containing protein [Hesseltinella vesiculosa]|uniref:ARM repeat-containing protein n=1 Tax=Hesseltinella vesiculosa TaxID=101127 RepID=A0A1X2GKR0_9FUNG|nr:ARM repeat-containing protein [Hesseltinella vesiculosa]
MNSTQTQPANSNIKPTLHGVKIKQRKGIQKAQAKHEPEVFRDSLLAQIAKAQPGDLEEISSILDKAGNTMEYRKYGENIFEVLIIGGILQPGGIVMDDVERSPFSIVGGEDDAASIKKSVDVFNKLIRRYKYLQRPLEETLKNILLFINKWTPEENSKLAKATAYFITTQLVPPTVLKVVSKDYLVKDGHSLDFVTTVFGTILKEQSVDQLGKYLTAAGLETSLLEFFPPNNRTDKALDEHFEAQGMKQLVEFHHRNQKDSVKKDLLLGLKQMLRLDEEEQSTAEVLTFIKENVKQGDLTEADTIPIVWNAVLDTVDLINTRPDQVESYIMRALKRWNELLEAYTHSPKSEVVLLQRVQINCYEDAKLTKIFSRIVQLLYKNDVLSDNAILYWADKAHKPQGKTVLMKQIEPFVNWLRENEDDSDEDDE